MIEPPEFKHYYSSQVVWTDKTPNAGPDWIELDFGKEITVGRVKVYPVADSLKDYRLELWHGGQWHTAAEAENASGAEQEHRFVPMSASKVRLFVTAARGANVQVSEIEVYEQ